MWGVYWNVFLYVNTIWLQTIVGTDIRFSNHGIILSQKMDGGGSGSRTCICLTDSWHQFSRGFVNLPGAADGRIEDKAPPSFFLHSTDHRRIFSVFMSLHGCQNILRIRCRTEDHHLAFIGQKQGV